VTGTPADLRVPIREEADVAIARKHARDVAAQAGLSEVAAYALATAISEIARNIIVHAGAGELLLSAGSRDGRRGIIVRARDTGPGIPELERALQDGYSTANGLGLGLPSARRLVDEFELSSEVGRGTTVVLTKWAG
jgi:anti-sigma regulatory factor (Ser/Thr protein kinase)